MSTTHTQTVIEVDDGNFQHEVLESDQPVLVEFGDEESHAGSEFDELLADLADKYGGRAKIARIDLEANWQFACNLDVTHVPTVLVFQHGRVVDRFIGERPWDTYCVAIDETLSPNWVI